MKKIIVSVEVDVVVEPSAEDELCTKIEDTIEWAVDDLEGVITSIATVDYIGEVT